MKETEIIRLFQNDLVDRLDDCAALPASSAATAITLVTTDSLSEGTHFRRDWSSPEDLAIKLWEANLSDLCVSGARPAWALLNLGLPTPVDETFLRPFAKELRALMDARACRLIGGDTFRTTQMTLTFTLGGPARRVLGRDDGRPGDLLYLTGTIGLALCGYRLLAGEIAGTTPESDEPNGKTGRLIAAARERHLRPRARADWAADLVAEPGVHAAMDLSDGLFQDAPRLARASGVSLEIDLDALPLAAGLAERGWVRREEAIYSGEEFEILFLGAPGLNFDFPCRVIGRASESVQESVPVRYASAGGPVEPSGPAGGGFEHFRD